ncbi:WXG100 family type VII secretion target [Nocardia sp. FBN12]|uniref:WXG100 family type VII secretion target n=1 Tax=Nocardia sp. FBN12 TaxID=3419766 RepID=UPI003D037C16
MRSLSGRTDVDYVSVVEVFDNLSHAEIHNAVRQLDPAALVGAGEVFLTTATGLGDGVEIAHGEIRAAIADGWRGAAAGQASDAVRDFEQAGRRIADVLTAVGVRLSQAGDAAESIRAAVAEPDGAQPDPAAALLDSEQAANNATIARDAENARLDAVQAMETIYAGAFLPTGSGVPAFTGIATETGTAAAGAAGSGTVPSAGIPQTTASAAIASATSPATTSAATASAGYSPVAGTGTTPTSNGAYPAAGTATGVLSATAPATTAPAARTAPGQPLTSANGASATTPPSTTTAAPGAVQVGNRPRPAKSERTGSATTDVAGADPKAAGGGPTDATVTSSAAAGGVGAGQVTGASTGSTTEAASDGRQERDPAVAGGEAAAGMGAGAIGGMMGGAMAAADQTRPAGGPRPAPPVEEPEDEDDEFLRYLEDEPTYLEPADEVNALIGKMEPTSPAVLGEWTERE